MYSLVFFVHSESGGKVPRSILTLYMHGRSWLISYEMEEHPTAEPATAEPATAEPATAEPATAEPATGLENPTENPTADRTKKNRAGKVLIRDSWWVNLGIHELSRTDLDPYSTVGTSELQQLHGQDLGSGAEAAAATEVAAANEVAAGESVVCTGCATGCAELLARLQRLEEREARSVDRAVEFRLAAVEMAIATIRTNSLRLVPATALGVNVNASARANVNASAKACSPSALRGGAGQEDYSSGRTGRAAAQRKRPCAHGKEQNECRQCAASGLSHLTRFCSHLQRKNMCKLCDLQEHGTLRKRRFDEREMAAEAGVFAEAMDRRSGLV
jgi:hypothetical protein